MKEIESFTRTYVLRVTWIPVRPLTTLYEICKQLNSQIKKEGPAGLNNNRGMRQSLENLSPGKSPGDDGFTADFYNCFFFDLVSLDLVNSQHCLHGGGDVDI